LAAQEPSIRLVRKKVNEGKGAAVRTAIREAKGDFCLVQDADLEYDPSEYPTLLRPLLTGHADAVFGSRYLVREQTRILPFWHSMINKTLTFLSNMFCNLNLTDMETCYKVFRTDLLKSIPIRSKRKLRIYEVPISYHGRTYEEGKKIGWKDGVKALGVILRFWLIDDLYVEPYGRAFLNNLTGTPQYLNWLARVVRPSLGDTVLELGAGIGNLAGHIMGRRLFYVASEKDPLYLHALRNRFLRTPNVSVQHLDPERPEDYQEAGGPFDTVLCVNVLEYVDDPAVVIRSAAGALKPGGSLIVLAPQSESLYGTLDKTLGHHRRFSKSQLRMLLESNGFAVGNMRQLNKIGTVGWWLYGKLLRRKYINKVMLKIFDKTVWIWRHFDGVLPWPGLSLVAVATKQAD
jgi:SAM-dependent methyltransferase